jgi:alpha-N-arabinofuranosidase
MYGKWQMGHMALDQYTIKHNRTVDHMRRVDPAIKIIGVGRSGLWSEVMLAECGERLDLLSEHIYARIRPQYTLREKLYLLSHRITGKIARYRQIVASSPIARERDIDLSLDEWNYWYGPQLFGEIGTRFYYQDALGVAICLHEFFRNSDMVAMAHYAQTVNVLGCIKTSKTAAEFATTALPLHLYRAEYGTIPVEVNGAPESIDVAAALAEDGTAVTVAVVNATLETARLRFDFSGGEVSKSSAKWAIDSDDLMAYNTPGKPRNVDIVKSNVPEPTDSLTLAPTSIALWRFPVKVADKSAGIYMK